MRTLIAYALIFVALLLTAPQASPEPAPARVDLSTHRTPAGTLLATYKASQGPGPFVLLTPVPGATFLGPDRWVVPVPAQGLPPLRFRLGNEVHTTFPLPGGGK